MLEEEIISVTLDEAFYIHKTAGPGMLENVYKTCLAFIFEEIRMECDYRADLVVESRVIIDTKTITTIGELHVAQILTYLRFLKIRHGLILNFNTV